MHELRTEKPWQHGVGPGFNSRRLHAEAPGSYVGPGDFLLYPGALSLDALVQRGCVFENFGM